MPAMPSPPASSTPPLRPPPPPSPWRYVHARVHVSLTPQELPDAELHAARRAYRGLLLRHHRALDGVAVAHASSFRLVDTPRLVGASPFAHVAATTKLLVFSPPPGTVLVGAVQHVGPDHVGLSVHSVFHAVLPLTGLSDRFRYVAPDRWRRVSADAAQHHHNDNDNGDGNDDDEADADAMQIDRPSGQRRRSRQYAPGSNEGSEPHDNDVVVGSRIRFAVTAVKPTALGLFQMLATLDAPPQQHPPLGPLSAAEAATLAEAEDLVPAPVPHNRRHNSQHHHPIGGGAAGGDANDDTPAVTVDIDLDGAAARLRARRRTEPVMSLGGPSKLLTSTASPPPPPQSPPPGAATPKSASQEKDEERRQRKLNKRASKKLSARKERKEESQQEEEARGGGEEEEEADALQKSSRKKRRRVTDVDEAVRATGDDATPGEKPRKAKRGKKRPRESGGAVAEEASGGSSLADAISRGMTGRRRASRK